MRNGYLRNLAEIAICKIANDSKVLTMREAIADVLVVEAKKRLGWEPPPWVSFIPSLISATNHSSTDVMSIVNVISKLLS